MKLLLTIICAVAFSAAVANAQTSSTTTTTTSGAQTTTTTTENVGKISEFTAGSTITLSTGAGEPVRYKLGKDVTYINAKGKVISADRIRKDRKVRVHYIKDGNDLVVDKVTVVKD